MSSKSLILDTNVTMSSLEIAQLTGKRHDHVMRDIRAMMLRLEGDLPKSGEIDLPKSGETSQGTKPECSFQGFFTSIGDAK